MFETTHQLYIASIPMKCQNLPNGFALVFGPLCRCFSPAPAGVQAHLPPNAFRIQTSETAPGDPSFSQVESPSQLQTVDQQSSFPKSEGTKDLTRQS
jgi:hypothetical protein